MQCKIHRAYRLVIAISDTDLLGKRFEEGKRQIEIHAHFFKGDEKTKEELIPFLQDMSREDATFNIVGAQSVETALEAGIISKEGIITIDTVPVALTLL